MPDLDATSILLVALALAVGGAVKGATGMGSPLVAVPVMAALFDVRMAVVVMVMPNVFTNLWQLRQFRAHHLPRGFALKFAGGGALGIIAGTALLAALPGETLALVMALAVIAYIALRLAKPSFRLSEERAQPLATPVGMAGGVLQGMAGISAPAAVSFLNAMQLERPAFIVTISAFFSTISLMQVPALTYYGLLTWPLLGLSTLALAAQAAAMPLGQWAARYMSAQTFDRLILGMLTILAGQLLYTALG